MKPALETSSGFQFVYERILTFLAGMPLLATSKQIPEQRIMDYSTVPAEDGSYVNCVLEAVRYAARAFGMTPHQAVDVVVLAKLGFMKQLRNDIKASSSMTTTELDLVNLSVRAMTAVVRSHNNEDGLIETGHLNEILAVTDDVLDFIEELDPRRQFALPMFNVKEEIRLKGICSWRWFDRIDRSESVEALAGESAAPPIMRPVELTLVPDKVSDFADVALAMRQAVNLCVLIANQAKFIRNSHTLRICLIEHLFIRVIPIPLPINHPERDTRCFWHAQPMRYETQADLMGLLHKLSRHFAASSFSIKTTNLSDSFRLMTFASIAAITDAVFRKIAFDIPCQASLHYSGRAIGPVLPFGFEVGPFVEESEYLYFSTPEMAAARTQVLDYFAQIKNTIGEKNMIFSFEKTTQCTLNDRRYIDQLCLQMGFPRYVEDVYLTGENPVLLESYPNIAVLRDILFMLKLLMLPNIASLPEERSYDPAEAALRWSIKEGGVYKVKAFGRTLDCVLPAPPVDGKPIRGILNRFLIAFGVKNATPRVSPSRANPSVLIGERVDTEDDILHIRYS